MSSVRLSALVLMTASVAAAHADVYKHVDAQGHVQYTDKPLTLPAERLNVSSRRTDIVELQARVEAERARQQAAEEQRSKSKSQRADQAAASAVSAKDQAERCTKARERYDNYMNSLHLYETLPDGERRYLSSSELDAARNSAKVSMDELCK